MTELGFRREEKAVKASDVLNLQFTFGKHESRPFKRNVTHKSLQLLLDNRKLLY